MMWSLPFPFAVKPADRRAASAPTPAAGEGPALTQSGHLRIPVLDGVRGLAVLMVLAVHSTRLPDQSARILHALGHWGSTGVDLFFVLSGFLITGILFEAKGGRHYFRNFYARRTLRIFPIYYVCVIFGVIIFPRLPAVVGYWLGPMYSGNTTWTFWAYLANFSIGHTGGAKEHGMLDVAWSLAIEEQFYLVWPLLVLLLSRKSLMRLCLVLMAVALAARLYLDHQQANWLLIYTNTFCRMDDLAAGAFVALAARGKGGIGSLRRGALVLSLLSIIGLLVVTRIHHWKVAWFTGPGMTYGYSLVAVLYASGLVLLISAVPHGLFYRLFASPVLRYFGRYSYAMYLLHSPALWFVALYFCQDQDVLRPLLGSYVLALAVFYMCGVALTLAAALVSWHVLERHCLALKRYFHDDVPIPSPRSLDKSAPVPLPGIPGGDSSASAEDLGELVRDSLSPAQCDSGSVATASCA